MKLAHLSLHQLHALKARVGPALGSRVEAEIAARVTPVGPPPREKDLEAQVIAELERRGWDVVKLSQPQRAVGMTKGTPDLYARSAKLRRRLWIEVKVPGGKVRPEQKRWHAKEREAGGDVVVVWSLRDLAEELDARPYSPASI